MVKQESLYVDISGSDKLHLRHLYHSNRKGPAVFLLHGAVENGKIFYTESNKGLAPFLAEQGFQCFVGDLRGRGGSVPHIDKNADYGQTESILHEIPAMLDHIENLIGKRAEYWVAHSWGGVLMNSVFARYPKEIESVKACAYFGTKRSLYNNHPSKLIKANLFWFGLAHYYSKRHGYLPAKKLRWGSDDESKKSHYQSALWAKKSPWIDSDDGFDYAEVLKNTTLPPTLHIAGAHDKALAQPVDIQAFIKESGIGIQKMNIYGKKYGHSHNYGHIDMLTHTQARKEQFQDVIDWFNQYATC
ncbi:alpha/beta fold hydrolase (plasmid) [Pseudoalteromonas sp. T1lg65]|uniref:alpha/beta fold hydrolase n=1 Tax=Pseudoalteromonas sp. T1lg65 TaxID=2077101 RepID=UPI003F7ADEDE